MTERDLKDYQDSYKALPFEETQARYRKKQILEFLHKYQPKRLLEIGCGLDPIFMHYTGFEQCTVVEPSDSFVQYAKQKSQSNAKIEVIEGLLQETTEQLKVKQYDFILLSSLLHELPDSKGLLELISSLCSDSTIVHINVPNALSFHRLLAYEMGLIDSIYEKSDVQKQMQQSHTFDMNSLVSLVEACSFEVVDSGSYFIKPFTHAQMAQLQADNMLNSKMLDGLFSLVKYFPENGSEIFVNVRLKE